MVVFQRCVLWAFLVVSRWVAPSGVEGSAFEMEPSVDGATFTFPGLGLYKFMAVVTSKAGVCSGTIVSEEWVLSAAHCFYVKDKPLQSGDARIIAGVINYEYPNIQLKQESMSKEIHIHPSFRSKVPSKYDVALVRLQDRFQFTKYVGSIPVAGDQWPRNSNDTLCMALGYGAYMNTASTGLKVWNMTAEHGEQACPCALRFQYKRLVCVEDLAGPMMCQGDDGGPLVCGRVVRAVAHMVWNTADCGEAVYPTPKCTRGPHRTLSTFMFLCPMADWMHSVVDVIPPRPPSCGGLATSPTMVMIVFLVIIHYMPSLIKQSIM